MSVDLDDLGLDDDLNLEDDAALDARLDSDLDGGGGESGGGTPELDANGQPKTPPPGGDQAEIARLQRELAVERARAEARSEYGGKIDALSTELADLRARNQRPDTARTPEETQRINESLVAQLAESPLSVLDRLAAALEKQILDKVNEMFTTQSSSAFAVGGDVVVDGFIARQIKDKPPKMAAALDKLFRDEVASLNAGDLLRKPKDERDRILNRAYRVAFGTYAEQSAARRSAGAPPNLTAGQGAGGGSGSAARGSVLAQCAGELGLNGAQTKQYARNIAERQIRAAERQARADKKAFTETDRDAVAIRVLAEYLDIKPQRKVS